MCFVGVFRFLTMVGLKVNAKAEQDGFLSVTLKEGNVSLQGKWPRFSEI